MRAARRRAPAALRSSLLAAALGSLPAGPAAAAGCDPGEVQIRSAHGEARFGVTVADEPGERAQGLMDVASLPAGQGMLFLYEAPQRATFWMRNTLIPLDMIFLDETGTVARIHENAVPLDETTIDGGAGILAVLEINGGLSRAIGLAAGDVLRHPGLPQDRAAWPCEGGPTP